MDIRQHLEHPPPSLQKTWLRHLTMDQEHLVTVPPPAEPPLLPDDSQTYELLIRFQTRFPVGTPLQSRWEVCYLEFSELSSDLNSLPVPVLTEFATRREVALSQL
jgi:hypothetical protein